jgi:hypothetical protein
MSIADLKTLATSPLAPKPKEESKIGPARAVLGAVGNRCVVRITAKQQGYECMRPFKEINAAKLAEAVKTFAAPWRACLAGWKEEYFADAKYTGFVGITFTTEDKKIVFYALGGEMVFAFSDNLPLRC